MIKAGFSKSLLNTKYKKVLKVRNNVNNKNNEVKKIILSNLHKATMVFFVKTRYLNIHT